MGVVVTGPIEGLFSEASGSENYRGSRCGSEVFSGRQHPQSSRHGGQSGRQADLACPEMRWSSPPPRSPRAGLPSAFIGSLAGPSMGSGRVWEDTQPASQQLSQPKVKW